MTLHYDDWEECIINTAEISLDIQNPRIPEGKRGSQDQIRDFMIQNEGIVPLASKISAYNGLFPHERIIVFKENGSVIVAEGNRRVCACSILLNPMSIIDTKVIEKIPQIDENTAQNISKLRCSLVKNRKVVDEVIAKIHLHDLRKNWSEIRQIRFITTRVALKYSYEVIADELNISTMEVMERIRWEKMLSILRGLSWDENHTSSTWSDEERNVIWDDFIKISPFTRIVDSTECRDHFGYNLFTNSGVINPQHYGINKFIRQICIDTIISQHLKTDRKVDKKSNIGRYLNSAFPMVSSERPTTLDLLGNQTPIKPVSDVKINSHASKQPATRTVPQGSDATASEDIPNIRLRKPNFTIFDDLNCVHTDNQRLTQLVYELRTVWRKYDTLKYAASFLLRATFEEALFFHLTMIDKLKKGKNYSVTDLLGRAKGLGGECFVPKQLNEKIELIYQRKHLYNLNCNSHNEYGNHTPERLNEIAGDLKPIIKFICT